MSLTLEEQETIFITCAAERGKWEAFTTDPVWMRRLEKMGAVLVEEHSLSRRYTLRAEQILIRKGKRAVSERQRAVAAERMKKIVANRKSNQTESD